MGLEAAVVHLTLQHKGQAPVPAEGKLGRCRGKACGRQVVFVRLPSGKIPPYDLDGIPHYATCPDAASFRKART